MATVNPLQMGGASREHTRSAPEGAFTPCSTRAMPRCVCGRGVPGLILGSNQDRDSAGNPTLTLRQNAPLGEFFSAPLVGHPCCVVCVFHFFTLPFYLLKFYDLTFEICRCVGLFFLLTCRLFIS